jgi:hypothetical protein
VPFERKLSPFDVFNKGYGLSNKFRLLPDKYLALRRLRSWIFSASVHRTQRNKQRRHCRCSAQMWDKEGATTTHYAKRRRCEPCMRPSGGAAWHRTAVNCALRFSVRRIRNDCQRRVQLRHIKVSTSNSSPIIWSFRVAFEHADCQRRLGTLCAQGGCVSACGWTAGEGHDGNTWPCTHTHTHVQLASLRTCKTPAGNPPPPSC